jgi:hypothetical protein
VPSGSTTEALDRLYAAPLEQFVDLRRQLAAELRARGEIEASREVAAAKKPSRPAWALNQVARRHPEQLRGVVEAHAAAAAAQPSGDAESMRGTARAFRDLLAGVVKSCGAVLSDAGARMTPSQGRQLGETVRAAVADSPTRARLLAGTLTETVETEDPFAGVEGAIATTGPEVRAKEESGAASALAAREREKARAREQRAREERARALEEARRRVDVLEADVRQARATAREAETLANRARADADSAKRAADDLEAQLAKARQAIEALAGTK